MTDHIIRRRPAASLIGESLTGLHEGAARGVYPPPIKVGPRASGYLASEVETIVRAKAAGLTDQQMRELATRLVKRRCSLRAELLAEVSA